MEVYIIAYLYLMGCCAIWWFVRGRAEPMAAKLLSVFLWPILLPFVALVW